MKLSQFFIYLLGLLLLILVQLFLVDLKIDLRQYSKFILQVLVGLSPINVFVHILSLRFDNVEKNSNMHLTLAFNKMVLKLIFTITIIAFFYFKEHPTNGDFVIPYILIYINFLIFEIFVISKQ